MLKMSGRALLKALLGFICLLAASLTFAQDHPLIAAVASAEAKIPGDASSNNPSSRLPNDAIPAEPIEAAKPSTFVAAQPVITLPGETGHRFWDRENTILFSAVGAAATADFFTTRANLASGGRELNPVTRLFAGSTPALAANFALETAGVIGISYMWHKTGHHRLERLTSLLDIGGSAGAVTYGLTHR
jgi:hypothetical protein